MHDPEFLREPLETLAQLLDSITDPDTQPSERARHARHLGALPAEYWQRLALDGDWQHLRRQLLGGEIEDGTLAGDGPWSRPEPDLRVPERRPALPTHLVTLYLGDLRTVTADEFSSTPSLPISPTLAGQSPARWAHDLSYAAPRHYEDTDDFGHALAWVCLHPTFAMQMLIQRYGAGSPALAAFTEAWETRPIGDALPPLVAEAVDRALSAAREDDQAWYDTVTRATLRQVATQFDGHWSALDGDVATRLLLALRLAIAHGARAAEVLDPHVLAAAELSSVVAVLRSAGAEDIRRFRAHGTTPDGFDPWRAVQWLQRTNATGVFASEVALTHLLRQPSDALREALDDADRHALRFLLERARVGGIHRSGGSSLLAAVGVRDTTSRSTYTMLSRFDEE